MAAPRGGEIYRIASRQPILTHNNSKDAVWRKEVPLRDWKSLFGNLRLFASKTGMRISLPKRIRLIISECLKIDKNFQWTMNIKQEFHFQSLCFKIFLDVFKRRYNDDVISCLQEHPLSWQRYVIEEKLPVSINRKSRVCPYITLTEFVFESIPERWHHFLHARKPPYRIRYAKELALWFKSHSKLANLMAVAATLDFAKNTSHMIHPHQIWWLSVERLKNYSTSLV